MTTTARLRELVTIRNATTEDIPAIAMLERACFSDPWPEDFIARRLERTMVAEESGAFLGYAVLSFVLDEGSLDSVAVVPEHRRRGTGDALMEAVVRRGRERGLAFITLEVRAGNDGAIALYKKHGFVQAGRRTNYYERPREDAILMTLVL